ncbi:glycosyltransferase family 4 protein [Natronorarus salvus]|uniref:glycosyltransferase family 4 protein n=1 Tax=Natronorarus salvus TaxID=3117733 RepID=UPI002F26C148
MERTERSVLVLANHTDTGRFERHYGPLGDVTDETRLLCLNPDASVDSVASTPVPSFGSRRLGFLSLLLVALYEGHRGGYDAVVSVSLFPYGCFALALKGLYGLPAHLGIIGIDLDHHAEAWYGALPRAAFSRFDTISVPGPSHVRRLQAMGLAPDRIHVLTNAIDPDVYRPDRTAPTEYDYLWVGRFSAEKDPLLFVEALSLLAESGAEFRAAMLGSGRLSERVVERVERRGLADRIDLPGWVDPPIEYYHGSRVFVSTSERDALPLTMLEAMATGLPCVVPRVGSIPDVVTHAETGYLLPDRDPRTIADALAELEGDPELYDRLATGATAIRSEYSYDSARQDWRRIVGSLVDADP